MVVVYQRLAQHFRYFGRRAQIDMDFRAGAARTGVTHFPEIVLFITQDNAVFAYNAFPEIPCLLVERNTIRFISFKHGYIQPVFRQFVNVRQQFPRPGNGFFLEIVTKRPVAEHFEHRVVVGIKTHIFKVVVLS